MTQRTLARTRPRFGLGLGLGVLVAALSGLLYAAPAVAAPSRGELDTRLQFVEAQIAEQNTRLQVLEDRMLTGDPAAVRLQSRVDTLEQTLRGLTGELEQARFTNRRLEEELRTLRRELELVSANAARQRTVIDGLEDYAPAANPPLAGETTTTTRSGVTTIITTPAPGTSAIGATTTVTPAPSTTTTTVTTNPADPFAADKARVTGVLGQSTTIVLPDTAAAALDQGKRLLAQGRFADAGDLLALTVDVYPDAPEVPEALFWEGESYYVRDDFARAQALYRESLSKGPTSSRAPDALVRLAATLAKTGNQVDACRTLALLPRQFPNASNAVRLKADREAQEAGCA